MKLLASQTTMLLFASQFFALRIGLTAAGPPEMTKKEDSAPRLRGALASKQKIEKELLELDHIEDMIQNGNFSATKHDFQQEDRELLYMGYKGFTLQTVSATYDEFTVSWSVPPQNGMEYSIELVTSDQNIYNLSSSVSYSQTIWPNSGDASGHGTTTFNRHQMRKADKRYQDGTFYYRIVGKNTHTQVKHIMAFTNYVSDAVRLGPLPGFDLAIPAMDTTPWRSGFNALWTIPSAYHNSPAFLEFVDAGIYVFDKSARVVASEQLCGLYNQQTASCSSSPRMFDKAWGAGKNLPEGRYRVRLVDSLTSASKVIYAASPQTFSVRRDIPVACSSSGQQPCSSCYAGWTFVAVGCHCNSIGYFP